MTALLHVTGLHNILDSGSLSAWQFREREPSSNSIAKAACHLNSSSSEAFSVTS